MDKEIDIIIPAYKSQTTIIKTLSSIVVQSIADKCKVTIVNDCDGIGYEGVYEQFKSFLDIQIINLPVNSGPGVARQTGIDNTDCKYIVFADADDTFYGDFALEILYNEIEKYPKISAVFAQHYLEERKPDLKMVVFGFNYVWMFAKIYRREIIKKYEIRLSNSRANEDVSFNRCLKLVCSNDEESPIFVEVPVYMWHDNLNSITRSINDFIVNENISGYVENMIYALKRAEPYLRGVSKQIFTKEVIITMTDCYLFYYESFVQKPEYGPNNFRWMVKFYKEFFEIVELSLPLEYINGVVLETLKSKKEIYTNFIPEETFKQFMNRIREAANEQ